MKRLMVYSHDTYGLGNLRRMLSICQHLSDAIADLTILLLSGSPMAQSFRLPDRLDYIKLPCLTRVEREGYGVRSLGLTLNETIHLRSDLILAAVTNFKPDLFMADKKPFGIRNELEAALQYLKQRRPQTKQVLVLRDILDAPDETIRVWERHDYHGVIRAFYDLVLVLGAPEIFDPRQEYQFPESSAARVRFCGYLRREMSGKSPDEVRQILGLKDEEPMVLVTAGGGQDGYRLLASYLESLSLLPVHRQVRSLMICGPEMSQEERQQLHEMSVKHPGVRIEEFTDDLISYLNAAEVVVSMAGYNTVCEILSARKKAIVVPRVRPVLEQWIRAERLHRQGLFQIIHPDELTPAVMAQALSNAIDTNSELPASPVNLDAQSQILRWVSALLYGKVASDE